tara:strand:+ start:4356 stop:5021 length:666 start_codon:yes stop_codon:yes gene_type:complete
VPSRLKIRYILLALFFNCGTYFLIQKLVKTNSYDFLTEIDSLIPFLPDYVWIYHSIIPAIFITMLAVVKTKQLFLTTFWTAIVGTCVLNFFYVFFPSFYPRNPFEVATISEYLVQWTREIDGSNNTFPSAHVTFTWIMFWGMYYSDVAKKTLGLKPLYLLWAIGVSLSTLVLKQHYIVDVFSGIFLATTTFYIVRYLVYKQHTQEKIDENNYGQKETRQAL